ATPDAPIGASLCDVLGKSIDPKLELTSQFAQIADLVVYGNQVPFYQARVNKLAVAVCEEAPFKISIVQPKVPLVQNGSMQLKVIAERKSGFVAPISLAMLFAPPGLGAGGATIPQGGGETLIPLNASGDALVRKWKICVVGVSEMNGPLW